VNRRFGRCAVSVKRRVQRIIYVGDNGIMTGYFFDQGVCEMMMGLFPWCFGGDGWNGVFEGEAV
jgi:hypothetical protein